MAVRAASRSKNIPVKVVVQKKPRTAAVPPAPVPQRVAPPIPKSPISTWSEAHRRRVMWITVGSGSILIFTIWMTVFSAQIQGDTPTFFSDVSNLIRNVQWPWEPKAMTPQEQEIRQLEEQVFPQFQ